MAHLYELTGRRFGRLVVIADLPPRKQQGWCRAKCDCGTIGEWKKNALITGNTRSCGCLHSEVTRATNAKNKLRHGEAVGGRCSSEYRIWEGMRARCSPKNAGLYPGYAGRGIAVDPKWQEFANFLSDMGRRPGPGFSIDRIDNDGNYEPGNCRWATQIEQTRNRRSTVRVSFNGETMPLKDWAAKLGLRYDTVWRRIRYQGLSAQEALTKPVTLRNRKNERAKNAVI